MKVYAGTRANKSSAGNEDLSLPKGTRIPLIMLPPATRNPPLPLVASWVPRWQRDSLLTRSSATVQKIISEILANDSGVAFAKDTRDLLIECCVEFITLISSEANEIAEREAKKTIACEHVQKALEDLGFGSYVQEILDVASDYKKQQVV